MLFVRLTIRIVIHLSINVNIDSPDGDAAYPKPLGGQPGFLFRLASDWVYIAHCRPSGGGSYPTISTLPSKRAVSFCCTCREPALTQVPPISRGILPCDVRTFLYSAYARTANDRFSEIG